MQKGQRLGRLDFQKSAKWKIHSVLLRSKFWPNNISSCMKKRQNELVIIRTEIKVPLRPILVRMGKKLLFSYCFHLPRKTHIQWFNWFSQIWGKIQSFFFFKPLLNSPLMMETLVPLFRIFFLLSHTGFPLVN